MLRRLRGCAALIHGSNLYRGESGAPATPKKPTQLGAGPGPMFVFVHPISLLAPFALADDNKLISRRPHIGVRRILIGGSGSVGRRRQRRIGGRIFSSRRIYSVDFT